MADEYKRTTRKRAFGESPDLQALQLALLEQAKSDPRSGNFQPGHTPSGTAMNVFLSTMPLSREQQREQDLLDESDARHMANMEDQRNRDRVLADQRASATARQFQTRTGVEERTMLGPELPPDADAPSVRTIRRFRSSATPVDPDAAMTAEQRARIDPRVLAADANARGDIEAAKIDAAARGKGGPTAAPYASERNRRNIESVQNLTKRVSGWTSGLGSFLAAVPGTEARDFNADLDTLKANIAFGELQAMREASKTGGALGAVSERELSLLESALGALDTGQSPQNLMRNLRLIEDSINRFEDARERAMRDTGAGGGGAADDPYEAYQRRRRGAGSR